MDTIAFVPKRRLLVAIAVALASSGATAATITVNSNDDAKTHKSCNLREAITSINNAAAMAKCSATLTGTFGDNDTIVFAPSLVHSVITLAQGELMITKPMTITGSSQSIDAGGKSTAFDVSYGALTAGDLTVQNGYSTSSAGGIMVQNGTLTLDHVTLAYNRGFQGGAIALSNVATANVADSDIHDNYAISGGAIATGAGAVTVSGTLIHDNAAMNSAGAFFVDHGSLAITDSVLANNSAAWWGGAIFVNYGSLAITDCVLAGNRAALTGGAISAKFNVSTALITGSTISDNSADAGGALSNYAGSFAITNSTLASNTASGPGGAIFGTKYSAITLTNVTVSGNTAAEGGAIWNTGPLHAFNSIVSANSAANSPEIGGSFTLTGNNNLFGTEMNVPPYNDVAKNNVFTDTAGLGPLQDNGGFTDTMALLAGSPAIDAGSNASAAALTTDQRGAGFARVVNSIVDIGAYEYSHDHIFSDGFESGP